MASSRKYALPAMKSVALNGGNNKITSALSKDSNAVAITFLTHACAV